MGIINDLITLPMNIFYIIAMQADLDLSTKWVQIVSFAAPIVSLVIFMGGFGFFIVTSRPETLLTDIFLGLASFVSHLLQLFLGVGWALHVTFV